MKTDFWRIAFAAPSRDIPCALDAGALDVSSKDLKNMMLCIVYSEEPPLLVSPNKSNLRAKGLPGPLQAGGFWEMICLRNETTIMVCNIFNFD